MTAARRAPLVSVIVPVLNEERALPGLLDHLAALPGRFEVIVADGGSRDRTVALARAHALAPRVVETPAGRARQMNAAARESQGEVLLFLHADTRLPRGAMESIVAAAGRAVGGNFALRFDGNDAFCLFLTALYALLRRFGVYYGDSSIWARATTFRALGGFSELPIMDDYEFVRRLERTTATACLPGPATTSARRWRRQGIVRTVATWLIIQSLFVAGVPPARLAGLYRTVR